jgi:hypothetical protein
MGGTSFILQSLWYSSDFVLCSLSCCPDVLSAMHLPADFLIHYGHACLTP